MATRTMPTRVEELSSSWPAPEQTWLRAFIEAIRRDYADVVQRAVLFGSKARADWKECSDEKESASCEERSWWLSAKVCGGNRTRRGADTQQVLSSVDRQRGLDLPVLISEMLRTPEPAVAEAFGLPPPPA